MSRLKDTILGATAYGQYAQAPMVDVRYGGQNGPMTDFTSYVSNTAYVRRQMIAILIAAPRGFNDLNNPQQWISTLKSLVELHAKSIEGLQSTVTFDYVENAVGGAGEMQEDIGNATRARSTPTFVWTEKYGMPINAFLDGWGTGLIMDPITKFPTVVSQGGRPSDLMGDYTGMTCLFFEPDPTMQYIVKAWLCTNMMPKTAGEVTGRRDMTQGGESVDYSVEFTALTQVGAGVKSFAQRILNNMFKSGLNPNLQPAFENNISADVAAGAQGYAESLATEAQQALA
jgi:hypothetical protein